MSEPINYSGPSSKPHDVGVAVAVVIARDGKVLLMQRKGSTGEGTWAIPGGKVDFGETPDDAVAREAKEETDLDVSKATFLGYTNDIHSEKPLHYVTLRFIASVFTGQEKIMELDKCSAIGWFPLTNLPEPLFIPTEKILEWKDVQESINQS